MTSNKVSHINKVCGLDRSFAEAEVRNRYAARLLGVVSKICLRVHICMVADDLNGVLVCADCTVRAETPELTSNCSLGSCVKLALAGK